MSDAAAPVENAVDILFVIDDSGTMDEEQRVLIDNFAGRFLATLASANGGELPSLHIGVVSTSLTTDPYDVPGCEDAPEQPELQGDPMIGGCQPPDDRYISDEVDEQGMRVKNYGGSLADTFECIARLGTAGCGFEQPLEAMRGVLDGSNPDNAGFLRPGVPLAVIILSDEDDCSTENNEMFNLSDTGPLGPLSSFRCFQFGVVCDPDQPRVAGTKNNCEPREDSTYMYPVGGYIEFLETLKGEKVLVAGLFGPDRPVTVAVMGEGPALQNACNSVRGGAAPAVRMHAFLNGFGGRGVSGNVCADVPSAIAEIANRIASELL